MVIPVVYAPPQLDELLESMGESFDFQELVKLMFGLIDDFCRRQPKGKGPGRPKTYTDAVILRLDMLMHLTGKRGETEILREVKRHYRQYFPQLPAQPRLWYRIRDALPLIEAFRRHLCQQLGATEEAVHILDTMPLPVALLESRPGQGNGFDLADWGHCASKDLTYYGFKLGLLITQQGIPTTYDLFPARPHDVRVIHDLLGDAADIIALGDKGFISADTQALLEAEQDALLITYRPRNQHQQNSPLEQWTLNSFRRLIETVFSQLDGHLHIQDTGAKTDVGLMKRVVGILTAYTLGIYLNVLLGRPLLAIKELFA